jgi:hypothetical protein
LLTGQKGQAAGRGQGEYGGRDGQQLPGAKQERKAADQLQLLVLRQE